VGEVKKKILPVKLFCGVIFKDQEILMKAKNILERRFGPIDDISDSIPFDQTDYYNEEMGTDLKRLFISFKDLIKRDDIVSIKLFTNKVEKRLANSNKNRKINLDPGYITLSNVSLATTKDFQHRIWLKNGIYLENTLRFRKGRWTEWEWTYPDYKTDFALKWFLKIHQIYKKQLNSFNFTKKNFFHIFS